MGNSKSKTVTKQVSESISNIASETVQSCEVRAYQTQNVNIVNTGWTLGSSFRVEQQSDISMDCFSDISKQNELQNKIINDLMQETTAEGQALWPAFGNTASQAAANITNIVRSNVTMRTIHQSYTEIRQEQNVNFTNQGLIGFSSVDISQGSKLFAAATLKVLESTGIFTNIENYVDQTSAARQKGPFDFLGSSIMWIVIGIIIIVVLAGVLIFSLFKGSPEPERKIFIQQPSGPVELPSVTATTAV